MLTFIFYEKLKNINEIAIKTRSLQCEKAKDINVNDFSKILYLVINPFLGASNLRSLQCILSYINFNDLIMVHFECNL